MASTLDLISKTRCNSHAISPNLSTIEHLRRGLTHVRDISMSSPVMAALSLKGSQEMLAHIHELAGGANLKA